MSIELVKEASWKRCHGDFTTTDGAAQYSSSIGISYTGMGNAKGTF